MKQRLLIFTNANDRSLSLFHSRLLLDKYEITSVFLEQPLEVIQTIITKQQYDVVYVRDPFTIDPISNDIEIKVTAFFAWQATQQLKIIDQTTTLTQLRNYEDKWEQYLIYRSFMPLSTLYDPEKPVNWHNNILKKRISSRAHGVYFDQKTIDLLGIIPSKEEYMWQEKLSIKEEYRIYSINGSIYPLAGLRTPTTPNQKARIYGKKLLSRSVYDFIKMIDELQLKTYHLDLVGYDVVETTDGSLVLLEQNKSPQISAFFRETGINLAEKFLLG